MFCEKNGKFRISQELYLFLKKRKNCIDQFWNLYFQRRKCHEQYKNIADSHTDSQDSRLFIAFIYVISPKKKEDK